MFERSPGLRVMWRAIVMSDCCAITLCLILYVIADVITVAKPLFSENIAEFEDLINTRSAPTIIEGPSPHVIYGVGDRVVLPCRGHGNPSPRYEWYYNGNRMETFGVANADRYVRDPTVDGTLHLKTSARGTTGSYQCHAINDLGIAISNNSRLDEAVFHPTTGRHGRTVVRNLTVIEGRSVVLHCDHFVSFPPATVSWFSIDSHSSSISSTTGLPLSWTASGKPAQPLQPSERFALDDRGGLVISNVAKADEMLYKCQAYNYVLRSTSGGSYQRIIVEPALYETHYNVPEIIFTSPPMIALAGNDVTLTCIFSSASVLQITWKRKSGEIASNALSVDYGRRLRLLAVTSNDAGLYVCTASDGVANSQSVVSLEVDALPTINRNLENYDVTVGGMASFECHGNGRPSPNYSWYINASPVNESTLSWRILNSGRHLELNDVTLVPGFMVTCNVSNVYGHVLSSSYVTVLTDVTDEPTSTQAVNLVDIETENETETDSYYDWAGSRTETNSGGSSDTAVIDVTSADFNQHIDMESSPSTSWLGIDYWTTAPSIDQKESESKSQNIDDVSTSGQNLETSSVVHDDTVDALLIGSLRQVLVGHWRRNSTAAVLILITISLLFMLIVLFTIVICRRAGIKRSTNRVRKQEQRTTRSERQTIEDELEVDFLNSKSTASTVTAIVPYERSSTSPNKEEDETL